MTRVVVVAGPGALFYWRAMAASKAEASTDAARRAAVLAQVRVADTAPFSWDYPIEGGETQFTWICPACGTTGGGTLTAAPGGWSNIGTAAHPSLVPDLDCARCGTRWRLDGGTYTALEARRRGRGPARRRSAPRRADRAA
jgi:hypothetical protein